MDEELRAAVRQAWADYHDGLDALGTWHDAQWVAHERDLRGSVESAVANLTRAEEAGKVQDRVMRATVGDRGRGPQFGQPLLPTPFCAVCLERGHRARSSHVYQFLGTLRERGASRAYQHRLHREVKAFFSWCKRMEIVTENVFAPDLT